MEENFAFKNTKKSAAGSREIQFFYDSSSKPPQLKICAQSASACRWGGDRFKSWPNTTSYSKSILQIIIPKIKIYVDYQFFTILKNFLFYFLGLLLLLTSIKRQQIWFLLLLCQVRDNNS